MTLLDFVVIFVVLLVAQFIPIVAAYPWFWVVGALIFERILRGQRI